MKIKIHLIPEEGFHLAGDEPPSILDVSEPLYRFEKPIHYELDVGWVGERSLFVRGCVSTVVRAQCVRTLEWFDLPIVVEDFQSHQSELRGDEVDLTQEIREDILLLLPTNPVSPQAKLAEAQHPPKPASGNNVWGILNQLKLK